MALSWCSRTSWFYTLRVANFGFYLLISMMYMCVATFSLMSNVVHFVWQYLWACMPRIPRGLLRRGPLSLWLGQYMRYYGNYLVKHLLYSLPNVYLVWRGCNDDPNFVAPGSVGGTTPNPNPNPNTGLNTNPKTDPTLNSDTDLYNTNYLFWPSSYS